MRAIVPTVVLLGALFCSVGAEAEPNANDYPLTGTVKCSFRHEGTRVGLSLNGQMLELTVIGVMMPLVPGDYKMRLVREKADKPYEMNRVYEMLFQDGSTKKFWVTGVGAGVCFGAAGQ